MSKYPKWVHPHPSHVQIVGGWHPVVFGVEYRVKNGSELMVLVNSDDEHKQALVPPNRYVVVDKDGNDASDAFESYMESVQ